MGPSPESSNGSLRPRRQRGEGWVGWELPLPSVRGLSISTERRTRTCQLFAPREAVSIELLRLRHETARGDPGPGPAAPDRGQATDPYGGTPSRPASTSADSESPGRPPPRRGA